MKIVLKDTGRRNHRFLSSTTTEPVQKWVGDGVLEGDNNWRGVQLTGENGKKIILTQDEMEDLEGLNIINKNPDGEWTIPAAGITFSIKKGIIKK